METTWIYSNYIVTRTTMVLAFKFSFQKFFIYKFFNGSKNKKKEKKKINFWLVTNSKSPC